MDRKPSFLVHTRKDDVGVAVVDLTKGEEVVGVYMDDGSQISLVVQDQIPLGHKIALRNIKKGEKVIEYAEPIGVATQDINKGGYVHVHNIKSLRW